MSESTRQSEESGGLRIGLLGPLVVEIADRPIPVTAARQRSVLAVLALQVGTSVSAVSLLEAVWGDDLPRTGSRAVAYQISKLRTLLEPDRVGQGSFIATTTDGYRLDLEPDRVDLHRFHRLVGDARTCLNQDPSRSEGLLDGALALWRGRPFADLGDPEFAEAETRRAERHHRLARRTMAEARIAQGRHVDTIVDLEAMVAEQPLEEALVQLLMTALHRAGRTAEALRSFGELRRRLSEELGIEPSRDLRRLEAGLLTEDRPNHRPNGGSSASSGDGRPAGDSDPDSDQPLDSDSDSDFDVDSDFGSGLGRRAPVPAALSSFVGRTAEISEIVSLLGSARLVTLSGFGGLGKTRLAQQIAVRSAADFADGVWFVDLTPVADPALLADTLIAAGGGVSADQEPADLLMALLAPLELLLVIDNCEHLVDEVAELVTRVVATAPGVRVLATSRRRLGVVGEAVRPVLPLDGIAAADLFVERARLASPGLAVDEAGRSAVERLTQRLEGIPLAIEMAAARLSVLTVEQIIEHLDDRFQLLTRNESRADHKQRSLAAVLDWSLDLLDPVDRRLLGRLSIFRGGFDLEAATALRPPELAPVELIDRIAHLVEVSLVGFSERDGGPRYHLLETVREHAAARLGSDESNLIALAHARYFERVATELLELSGRDMGQLLAGGDRELGNIRSAIAWCYASDQPILGLSITHHPLPPPP
ncbi:MAG: AfsR/SARP family transcriptional regulator, partial [Acidimicrobiales bacterium]